MRQVVLCSSAAATYIASLFVHVCYCVKFDGEVEVASRGQEIISVASHGLSTLNMKSCFPRLVRNCISCIERYGCTKCPTIGRFLHSFVVLYFVHNYMHTYRTAE